MVDAGREPDGRRIRKWHSGYATKRDAEAARVEILSRLQTGDYVAPSRITVAEFAEEWLAARRSQVRPGTWDSYALVLRRRVLPHLGPIRLRDLTAARINAFYADLTRAKGGGDLSPRTVKYTGMVLSRMLKDGVRWGRIARNPADFADPPKVTNWALMATWTAKQLRSFLDHLRTDRLSAAWTLLATTGCRRGECLGLRWTDLDLDANRATIVQSIVMTDAGPLIQAPKTNRGRAIALDAATVAVLREHRRRQLEERMAWGPAWVDTGLVFTRENGSPIRPDNFSRAFEAHARAAGLPRIRVHDVRHTYASLALAAAVPVKVVSERLGHANVSTTMNVYAHVLPGMQEDAAERVAAVIFGR